MADSPEPTPELAAAIAETRLGWRPERVTRFTTGAAHYVYEALGPEGQAVVVRIGMPYRLEPMAEGVRLMEQLAALGVPLPALHGHGTAGDFPYMLMERLPGTDLGDVIGDLSDLQLEAIAGRVAAAQAATARLGVASRFGYAATGTAGPHGSWTGVVEASLQRSRERIAAHGYFAAAEIGPVMARFEALRPVLDRQPAIPFLHDTTTRNVIVHEGRFSGIVDVDDLCFGDPRYAPALTLAVLKGYGGPQHYVGHWMRAAGHGEDEVFGFYVALFLLDLMSEHGAVFNGNERASTVEARTGLQAALAEALA